MNAMHAVTLNGNRGPAKHVPAGVIHEKDPVMKTVSIFGAVMMMYD